MATLRRSLCFLSFSQDRIVLGVLFIVLIDDFKSVERFIRESSNVYKKNVLTNNQDLNPKLQLLVTFIGGCIPPKARGYK